MKFADLAAGQTVFLDANPLVDHFSANPTTDASGYPNRCKISARLRRNKNRMCIQEDRRRAYR